MWHGQATRLLIAMVCALLAACVQQPGKPLAGRHVEAIEANRNAERRFRGGDLDGAVLQYQEALRIAQSIEDIDGIAANAISLSVVYQRLGKNAEAGASLAPVLEQSRLSFPPARLAQAALRRAVLEFDEKRFAGATGWLEIAGKWCGRAGCALSAAINNLRALLALEEGNTDAAAETARMALKLSLAAGDRLEAANALRLLGNAAIRAGEARAALTALNEALVIDRELELPRKIYLDLIGLGRASQLGGEGAVARNYFERALAVAAADRDAQAVDNARELLRAGGGN